jgi:hypothetical protein
MSKIDHNGNFKDIVAELRSVAMIETGLLYSRRLMLNQASEEIERLRSLVSSANDNSARYCREMAELESRLAEARADALEEIAKIFESRDARGVWAASAVAQTIRALKGRAHG